MHLPKGEMEKEKIKQRVKKKSKKKKDLDSLKGFEIKWKWEFLG